MKDTAHIVVFITTSTIQEAEKIAARLLEDRKVACATVVPMAESRYWWKGNIDSSKESLLILKTKGSVFTQIVDIVKQIHSYEVPEIIALPISNGNSDYLNWIDSEVKE